MRFSHMLKGGDRRSIGRADKAAALVHRYPDRFPELWACLSDADPLVRMRAADALEKLSRKVPALFEKHKPALLSGRLDDGAMEVRWHLLAILGRLSLSRREAKQAVRALERHLHDDDSRIVKVMALQAAADISDQRPELAATARKMLDWALTSPWPSVRARARRIIDERSGQKTGGYQHDADD